MNDFDYPGSGPCADYEFEIAELLDGALSPERARIVSLHLTSCVRCRAWRDRYAAVDRQLAEAIVAPPLSADFASRLKGRLATETRAITGERREAIEREYSHELELLDRGWKIPAVLNGIAAAAVSGCLYLAWRSYSIEYDVNTVLDTPWLTTYSLLSTVAVGSALVWSFRSGAWIRRIWR
jgi:predicted anti-sigma-YlaC factor YlaD